MNHRYIAKGSRRPSLNYLAHMRQTEDESFVIHELEEHLRAVGDLAGEFASSFGHSDWGRLAGRWHDLGKYSVAFQIYIDRERESAIWMQRVGE